MKQRAGCTVEVLSLAVGGGVGGGVLGAGRSAGGSAALREAEGEEGEEAGGAGGQRSSAPSTAAALRAGELAQAQAPGSSGGGGGGGGGTESLEAASARGTGMLVRRVVLPGKRLACNSCGGVELESTEAHREHHRSDWHRLNCKRKVKGEEAMPLEAFEAMPAAQRAALLATDC